MKSRQPVLIVIAMCLALAACGSRIEPINQAGGIPGQPVTGSQGPFAPGGVNPTTGAPIEGNGGSGGQGPSGPSLDIPGLQKNCRSAGATDVGVTQDAIRLGAVISLTGPLPGQFDAARDAVASYIAKVNEGGGICGRRLLWSFKDDQGDTTNNRNRTQDLIKEKVFGFVGSHSANDAGMAQVLCPRGGKPLGIPDIGFQLDWAHAECPTSFGVPGQVQRRWIGQGAAGTQYLNKVNNIKKAALFWVRESEVSILSAWAFEAAMLKSDPNLEICYEQETSVFETSFTQYIFKLEDRCGAADTAVYSAMENNNNIRLARAMNEQEYRPKIYGTTFTSYLSSFAKAGATEGAYMAMPMVPLERCQERNGKPVSPCSHPELDRYVSAVNRFFPNSPRPGSFGAPAWGQAALMVQAIASCGARVTRVCVLDYLRTSGPFSANGFLSPTRPGNHRVYTADLLVQVRNGRFVEVPKPAGYQGPPGAEHFWNTSNLFNWWTYYCNNKSRFLNTPRKDAYIDC